MDGVSAVKHVCEKYLKNGKDVFCGFMDLEKAYHIDVYSIGMVCDRS